MKKLAIFASTLCLAMSFSNSFAGMKMAYQSDEPSNGKDYVGTITAALYENGDHSSIRIITVSDGKNASNLKAFHLLIDEKDLPFGFTLANSIGKKIAINDSYYKYGDEVKKVNIVTDEYWYGDKK